jgi:primosomal protein N' (replication factor Y)
MLAKGHHFPNVSLAVILGLDNSFFSSDFRGAERMGQLLTQVAGRAGREKHQGTVLLQTQFSDHPLLRTLLDEGYPKLAQQLLAERRISDMPPFTHLALIRCHAQQANIAVEFLQQARQLAQRIQASSVDLQYIGPFPATLEKRNNRYYYYLQIKAKKRSALHYLLQQLCPQLEQQRQPKGLHWLIDVDPQEM